MAHNESDYTPTVEHAQIHQKLLQHHSRNVRLPTEAELAAQANEEAAKWAAVKEVEIKIRFPDQSAVSAKFGQDDTGSELYGFVRECFEERWQTEPFVLRNSGIRGKNETIPDSPNKKLIRDLQLKGRVLVIFGWDDTKASVEARGTKAVLKPELRAQAQELKVPDFQTPNSDAQDDPGVRVNLAQKDSGPDEGGEKKKMPKWLKGFGKK
jgi:tether containing UBX domain for GLUT4